jgi:hypothetical protein
MPAVIRSGCRAKKNKGFAPFSFPSFPLYFFLQIVIMILSLFFSDSFHSPLGANGKKKKLKVLRPSPGRTSEQKNLTFLLFSDFLVTVLLLLLILYFNVRL